MLRYQECRNRTASRPGQRTHSCAIDRYNAGERCVCDHHWFRSDFKQLQVHQPWRWNSGHHRHDPGVVECACGAEEYRDHKFKSGHHGFFGRCNYPMRRSIVKLFCVALLLTKSLSATTVKRMDLQQLVEAADSIVQGRVEQ